MKYTGDDERLREMDEEDLNAMTDWLIDGKDPEDMALNLLEHMSDDEIAGIQKALADEKAANQPTLEEQLAQIPAEHFKAAFIVWYGESQHGGWDGFNTQQLNTFEKFMDDFVKSWEYTTQDLLKGSYITFGGVDFNLGDMK